MQKKLFLLNLVFLSYLATSLVMAKEASPSHSTTITDSLKERIQQTIQTAKQNLLSAPTQPMAFVGKVEDIIQQTINIQTPQDNHLVAIISDDTVIIRSPGNKEIKLTNVRIDDRIIAMGYPRQDGSDTLQAKRVIVSQNLDFTLKKITGFAKIIKKTASKLEVELTKTDNQTEPETLTLQLSSQTVIKTPTKIIDLQALQPNQTIIFTATTTKKLPQATIIMLVDNQEQ